MANGAKESSFDRLHATVQGMFGLALGAGVGFCIRVFLWDGVPLALAIALPAVAAGLAAAFFGDRFWRWLKDSELLDPFDWF